MSRPAEMGLCLLGEGRTSVISTGFFKTVELFYRTSALGMSTKTLCHNYYIYKGCVDEVAIRFLVYRKWYSRLLVLTGKQLL